MNSFTVWEVGGTEYKLRLTGSVIDKQSAAKFFFDKYPQEASIFMFGHTEAITDEMCKEYIEWCKTDEGRSYLKGGANYKEDVGERTDGDDNEIL